MSQSHGGAQLYSILLLLLGYNNHLVAYSGMITMLIIAEVLNSF